MEKYTKINGKICDMNGNIAKQLNGKISIDGEIFYTTPKKLICEADYKQGLERIKQKAFEYIKISDISQLKDFGNYINSLLLKCDPEDEIRDSLLKIYDEIKSKIIC